MLSRILTILFIGCTVLASAQKHKTDSINRLLVTADADTSKVTLLWNLSSAYNTFNPDSALIAGRQALTLAKDLKFVAGESRALGVMANAFISMGNYPRALEHYILKLKIDERLDNPRNLASVYINIGVVNSYQEAFDEALLYYLKADSIVRLHSIKDLDFYIALNIGDAYNRINSIDSAFRYFQKALNTAAISNDAGLMGAAMVGLGHCYFKEKQFLAAAAEYHKALPLIKAANDVALICEAKLGLAKLHAASANPDSSAFYARTAYLSAKENGFLNWQLDASIFLTNYYKNLQNTDSALYYMETQYALKDSVESKERIKELQIMSSNEQLRQIEMEETKQKQAEERRQQLQLLFIAIFIPGIFLITLLLSKIKIHVRIIKIMGILSLLIFFEYLTLLLHPAVAEFTHHTPVYELLIFVTIAAILIPAHHRIEHWLIAKLTYSAQRNHWWQRRKVVHMKTKSPSTVIASTTTEGDNENSTTNT